MVSYSQLACECFFLFTLNGSYPFVQWSIHSLDLCDCCRFGCCHPVICLGFWCNPGGLIGLYQHGSINALHATSSHALYFTVLLAQVMTRLKLNWNGEAGNKGNTFKVIVGIWIVGELYVSLASFVSVLLYYLMTHPLQTHPSYTCQMRTRFWNQRWECSDPAKSYFFSKHFLFHLHHCPCG